MMKRSSQALALAALIAAHANAQSTTTVVNNPSNPSVVTSYFSICPTATTTTITLSTTTTICPGPACGGTTTLEYVAQPITTVGADGRTTVFEQAHYTAPCACNGGICDAVYTMTRPCPCTAPWAATGVPAGFTTTVVACSACAQNGGPSSVTIVTPVSNGPYASQTPAMGAPQNGVSANAVASAYAYAYAYASVGPNGAAAASAGAAAGASAGNGNAAANANASANAYANNGSNGSNGSSGASAGAQASAAAGKSIDAASIGAGSIVASVASTAAPTSMPSGSSTNSSPVASYTGSAHRAVYAFSAVAAGVVGWLAVAL